MPTSTYFTGPIEKRMSDDLHLAGVAERTRKGYLRAVRQLAEHAKCSPDKIDEEQLRQWLLHLKVDKSVQMDALLRRHRTESDGLGEADRSKSLRPTGSGSASLLEQST